MSKVDTSSPKQLAVPETTILVKRRVITYTEPSEGSLVLTVPHPNAESSSEQVFQLVPAWLKLPRYFGVSRNLF